MRSGGSDFAYSYLEEGIKDLAQAVGRKTGRGRKGGQRRSRFFPRTEDFPILRLLMTAGINERTPRSSQELDRHGVLQPTRERADRNQLQSEVARPETGWDQDVTTFARHHVKCA